MTRARWPAVAASGRLGAGRAGPHHRPALAVVCGAWMAGAQTSRWTKPTARRTRAFRAAA